MSEGTQALQSVNVQRVDVRSKVPEWHHCACCSRVSEAGFLHGVLARFVTYVHKNWEGNVHSERLTYVQDTQVGGTGLVQKKASLCNVLRHGGVPYHGSDFATKLHDGELSVHRGERVIRLAGWITAALVATE